MAVRVMLDKLLLKKMFWVLPITAQQMIRLLGARGHLSIFTGGQTYRCCGSHAQVFEETGYDMRPLAVNAASHLLQRTIVSGTSRKPLGLFIVPGVDEAFPFQQQCEGEIDSFSWFCIDDLAKVLVGKVTLAAGATGAPVRLFQVRPS